MSLLAGFVLTAAAGLGSEGVYHEDDLKHFLFARWCRHDARYLIDAWGRPGFTVPYALPAMIASPAIGWPACRLLSAVLSAATAWLAYRIARHYRLRHAWLAIPLVYLQPLFTHLSLTTLTETPLAFYCALATWLLLKHRPIASAAVIALAPVTRCEAIVLLVIWPLALWRTRARWPAYPALLWALVLHNLLAAAYLQYLPISAFLKTVAANPYGNGTPLTYVPRLLLAAGPVVVALAILGSRRLIRRRTGWLVAAAPALYFVTETTIYLCGVYPSGGYARFLVPIAPWLAILATAGLQPIFVARRPAIRLGAIVACGIVLMALWAACVVEWWWRPPVMPAKWQPVATAARIAAGCVSIALIVCYAIAQSPYPRGKAAARWFVVTVAAILLLVPSIWAVIPLRLQPQHRLMQEAATVLETPKWRQRPLITVSYWPYYWTGRWRPSDHPQWPEALDDATPGTLFVWDARMCLDPDHRFPYAEMANRPQWHQLWPHSPGGQTQAPLVAIFERQSSPTTSRPTSSSAPAQTDFEPMEIAAPRACP